MKHDAKEFRTPPAVPAEAYATQAPDVGFSISQPDPANPFKINIGVVVHNHPPPAPEPENPFTPPKETLIAGVNSFPTEIPPEMIILNHGWLRRKDIATFVSTAGSGKSVAVTQMAIAWGMGMAYMGLKPPHPLRILVFSGEDDEVTIGQCREGFLLYSQELTGHKLDHRFTGELDKMLRFEFSRQYVGAEFHTHLAKLLEDFPADLVIVNPLISYIGGDVVKEITPWLRAGLTPVLDRFNCGCIIAAHTPKMAKDSWENTEDVYAALGGGDMANAPRAIMVLRPTAIEGLSVINAGKRKFPGWKDGSGNYVSSFFVRRSHDPSRPAWLPVPHDEALDELSEESGNHGGGQRRKVGPSNVVEELSTGEAQKSLVLEKVGKACGCHANTVKNAVSEAIKLGLVIEKKVKNPKGGLPITWLALTPKNSPQ